MADDQKQDNRATKTSRLSLAEKLAGLTVESVLRMARVGFAILAVSGYTMPIAEAQPHGEMRGGRSGGPADMRPSSATFNTALWTTVIGAATAVLVAYMFTRNDTGRSVPGIQPDETRTPQRWGPVPPLSQKAFDRKFGINTRWEAGQSQRLALQEAAPAANQRIAREALREAVKSDWVKEREIRWLAEELGAVGR